MLEKTAKTTFEAIDETIKETSLHLKNAQVSRHSPALPPFPSSDGKAAKKVPPGEKKGLD